MRQLTSVLCAAAIAVVSIGLAGAASADYWEIEYDLEGSTSTTITALGSDVDPVTGTITFRCDGGGSGETPSNALYVEGNQHIDIYWQVTLMGSPVMTLDGYSNSTLKAGWPGVVGNITGASLTLTKSIPDQTSTGQMHCADAAGECVMAGFTNSVSVPLAPQGPGPPWPFPYPKFIFTGSKALVGSFTSTTSTQTATPNATVKFNYVGKEISRVFRLTAGGDLPVLSSRGLAGLGLSLALVGAASILGLRRRRGTKRG